MKEAIKELNENFKKYRELSINYDKAMYALANLEFENKSSIIDELRQKSRNAEKRAKEYADAVSAMQKVCTHTHPEGTSAFNGSGHDSHYSYETCDICGYERKV